MKTAVLLSIALVTGCTAEQYMARADTTPDNATEISVDPIRAPSAMSNACGSAGYTVDDSSTPIIRDPGDRDRHDVTFHCNDGSKPNVTRP